MTRTWSDLSPQEKARVLGKPLPPMPPESADLNGTRIKQARELRGMSAEMLAEELGVDVKAIALMEEGGFQPSEEICAALVLALGFPLPFFKKADPPALPIGSLLLHEMQTGYLCDICDAEMQESVPCPLCGKDMCADCQQARDGRMLCLLCADTWDEAHKPKLRDYWQARRSKS